MKRFEGEKKENEIKKGRKSFFKTQLEKFKELKKVRKVEKVHVNLDVSPLPT